MKSLEQVRASFETQRYMQFLGAKITALKAGCCEITLPYREELTQQDKYFHAGVISAIADTAAGYAAYTLMRPEDSVLTVEYKLNLLSPGIGEALIARSTVLKSGRTLSVCSSDIFAMQNKEETLCATATVTLIALPNYKKK